MAATSSSCASASGSTVDEVGIALAPVLRHLQRKGLGLESLCKCPVLAGDYAPDESTLMSAFDVLYVFQYNCQRKVPGIDWIAASVRTANSKLGGDRVFADDEKDLMKAARRIKSCIQYLRALKRRTDYGRHTKISILKSLVQVQIRKKKGKTWSAVAPAGSDCLSSMDAALPALEASEDACNAAVEDDAELPPLPLPDASGTQSGEETYTPGAPTDPLVLNLLPAWAALVKNLS